MKFFCGVLAIGALASCQLAVSPGQPATVQFSVQQTPANLGPISVTVTRDGHNNTYTESPATSGQLLLQLSPGTYSVAIGADVPTGRLVAESARFELLAGQSATVSLQPRLQQRSVVVPDPGNGRLIQIDRTDQLDATNLDTEWRTFGPGQDYESSKVLSIFQPYDVDLGPTGHIYWANKGSGATDSVIVRMDDIKGTNETVIVTESSEPTAVAVDWKRGILYWVLGQSTLRRCNVASCKPETVATGFNFPLYGLDIRESDGMLALAGVDSFQGAYAVYDPSTATLGPVEFFGLSECGEGWDMKWSGNRVYAAHVDCSSGAVVAFAESALSLSHIATYSTNLAGVRRFVAPTLDTFVLIDEDGFDGLDMLVSMDSAEGKNRRELAGTGIGDGEFTFFVSGQLQ